MVTNRRAAIIFILIYTMVFYAWVSIFKEDESLRILGTSVFSFIGGLVGFIWIIQTIRVILNKQRYFWLLLGTGILFYLVGHAILFFSQLAQEISFYNTWGNFMWLMSYFLFLIALLFQIKVISSFVPKGPHKFNIIIFVIIAKTLSIHFLIKPIWEASNQVLGRTLISITFPILDLSILFVLITLFYLNRYPKQKRLMLFISAGFAIQISTDTIYAYLLIIGKYQLGSLIDPLWPIALLILGFASFYANEFTSNEREEFEHTSTTKADIFPYIASIFLLILTIGPDYKSLNILSVGLIIIMLMVIGRQLLIMKKNQVLMSEYKYLAYHDPLTGLNNRTKFIEDLIGFMERAKSSQSIIALILIDLDRFKNVNDTLGHEVGDHLLVEAAERLKHCLEPREKVYRIGGDEFIIVLSGKTERDCINVSETIMREFASPFLINDYEIAVSPSVGISISSKNGEDAITLLKNADAAMYLAKERGRNNYQFYDSKLDALKARKMQIDSGLRKALEHNEFRLFYQPKVDLQTGKMIGMEALLRWEHPELGPISPGEFIPIAEETGQIVAIGEWVLKSACAQNKIWQNKGLPIVCVSVNVSVLQFQHSNFSKTVRNVLEETGLHPMYLELEITESIMQDIKESTEVLNALRTAGVRTSLDDFGKGYSSLHILKELPIDTIKIDKSFIDDMVNEKNQSMVKTIIDIGLNLNLNVVAEGIEHEHQVEILKENKCTMGQGYLFAKPVDVNEFEIFLLDGVVSRKQQNNP
jgi:diguanylate cyclase (GGDEF)-like protein